MNSTRAARDCVGGYFRFSLSSRRAFPVPGWRTSGSGHLNSNDGCLLIVGSSASALPFGGNNLNILRDDVAERELMEVRASVVHCSPSSSESVVNTVCWTTSGTSSGHVLKRRSQVKCKSTAAGNAVPAASAFVLQACWIKLKNDSVTLLVVATSQAIQVYGENGDELASWRSKELREGALSYLPIRVFAILRDGYLAVGLQNGDIQMLSLESRRRIALMAGDEIKSDHPSYGISALIADSRRDCLASGGDDGRILVHQAKAPYQRIQSFEGYGFPCCGILFWKDTIVAAYGSGHLRLFDVVAGRITVEITAHVGWITGLDGAEDAGLVLSTSEDSFVRVWQLCASGDQESPVALKFSECIPDVRLCGGRFLQSDGRRFALTGYELEEIMCYSNLN